MKLPFVVLLLGITPFCSSAQVTTQMYSAGSLVKGCKEMARMDAGEFPPASYEAGQIAVASIEAGGCLGFINGFLSGYGYANSSVNAPPGTRKICIPAGVTQGQIARVLVARLEEKPEFEHLPAAAYVPAILQLTWPCATAPTG